MNDLTIFNHLGNDIRVMTDEQGDPWFVLKDVCDALEIGNTSRVASRLDSEDLTLSKVIDNRGVQQETFLVSEAGLYEVIIRSDKPEAKAFRQGYSLNECPCRTPGLQRGSQNGTPLEPPGGTQQTRFITEVARRLDEDDVHQADVIDKVGRNQKTRPSDGGYALNEYPFYSLPDTWIAKGVPKRDTP